MIIKIGADELILWLRKNGKVVGVANNGIDGLGRRIYNLIDQLQGKKIEDAKDKPSQWSKDDTGSVGKYKLPKTAAQYEIDTTKLDELYTTISGW